MRIGALSVVALGLLTAACGSTEEQRAATGGATGVLSGALIGGPIGALVGGAVGAGGGAMLSQGVDTTVGNVVQSQVRPTERQALSAIGGTEATPQSGSSLRPVERQTLSSGQPSASAGSSQPSRPIQQDVRQIQTELQSMGLYNGQIDGIVGPKTRSALRQYQQQQGLTVTGEIDQATLERLRQGQSRSGMSGSSQQGGSGGQMLSESDVRNTLQRDGYADISDLRRQGSNYTATATQNGRRWNLTIDGATGQIGNRQPM